MLIYKYMLFIHNTLTNVSFYSLKMLQMYIIIHKFVVSKIFEYLNMCTQQQCINLTRSDSEDI